MTDDLMLAIGNATIGVEKMPLGFALSTGECQQIADQLRTSWLAEHDREVAAKALIDERDRIRCYTLNFGSASALFDQIMFLLERDAGIVGPVSAGVEPRHAPMGLSGVLGPYDESEPEE